MANIKAFRAWRYDQNKAGKIEELYTPPYDIINEKMQDDFYQINPYNMIRLEWGKKYPDDTQKNNRYTRAATDYDKWRKEGILLRDAEPAFYLYRQTFETNGQTKTRNGVLATIRAEGYESGAVLPHEDTLPKHKADRLELMRHTFANFSPIFGLYAQESRHIDRQLDTEAKKQHPVIDFSDADGVKHSIWKIDNPDVVTHIEAQFANLKIYIADGHHRYETASFFAKETEGKGIINHDRILIALVNLYDPGLVILPTHRLIKNIPDFDLNEFIGQLIISGFILTKMESKDRTKALSMLLEGMAKGGKEIPSFGLYAQGQFYLLQIHNKHGALYLVDQQKSDAYRELDVTLLHTLILENLLGISPKELAEEGWVDYTQSTTEALEKVDNGQSQMAFLLNSTLVEELLAVADSKDKMPQKSTFFYPKMVAGLLINQLD